MTTLASDANLASKFHAHVDRLLDDGETIEVADCVGDFFVDIDEARAWAADELARRSTIEGRAWDPTDQPYYWRARIDQIEWDTWREDGYTWASWDTVRDGEYDDAWYDSDERRVRWESRA